MHTKARPYILAEATWETVENMPYEVAVLPWGATEAHNYHLPYATDNIQCDYIAAEAARIAWDRGARVVVLPTIPFGVNTGQLDIKLDINMYPSTQLAVLNDITETLSRQAIPKLVILNGHGGNDFRQICRELQVRYPDVFLTVVDWFKIFESERYFEEQGDHAGEMETSMMLYIAPDLVTPLDRAGDGFARRSTVKALNEGWAWAQREWTKVTSDTGIGNPHKSTPEKGRIFLDDLTAKIGSFFLELAAADKTDLYER